jgi:WD40 repeat protein
MRVRLFSMLVLASVISGASSAQPPSEAKQERGPLGTENLDGLWNDLADTDAGKAYRAIWALTQSPRQTVACITRQLQPAIAPDPRRVERFIEDLNSETFTIREKANLELTKLGGLAESSLRKALKADPTLETRQRVEKLLSRLLGQITLPEHLREVRVIETLELIGSAEAKTLLAKYATGAPGARLTHDAKDALERLLKDEVFPVQPKPSRTDLYGDLLPLGAVGRLGTIRFRRDTYGSLGLSFLSGGKEFITVGAGKDEETQVWEVSSGRLLRSLSFEPLYVSGFALAPDGKHFAVAGSYPPEGNMPSPGEIRVCAFPSGKLVNTIPRTRESVECREFFFSPDGKILFSLSSREEVLRIEEISSGKELARKEFPKNNQTTVALSNDGTYLGITSGDGDEKGKLLFWKWRSEKPVQFEIPHHCPDYVSFSPDGKLFAGVANLDDLLQVWEVPSGRRLYHQKPSERDYVFDGKPAFTPDGKTLVLRIRHRLKPGYGKIQLLDPATSRLQGVLESNSITGEFAVSADSRKLVIEAGKGARIWDLISRKELPAGDGAHQLEPTHFAFSSKGFLVTASPDGTVRVWDAATTKQLRKFSVGSWIWAIRLSPDDNLLAASSDDDAVHVWDSHTGREVQYLAGHGQLGRIRTLVFLPDCQGLLSWGDDFYLRLWDLKTGKVRFEHSTRPQGIHIPDKADIKANPMALLNLGLRNAAITRNGKILVIDIAGYFHLFDTGTGKQLFKFPSVSKRGSMVISPNSKYILISNDGESKVRLSMFELSTGTTIQSLLLPGSWHGPVAFAHDGRMFATAVNDRQEILIFETASGNVRTTIRGFHGKVFSLAFFPDGRRLASGMSDSTALIWDLTSQQHLAKGP